MTQRPNILFLMSDEHRADVTGYEGNRVIRTPVLDWLAETGVTFRNAYTPSPICIPGRQAIMAGQFPNHCGCRQFGQDLPPGHMTFSRRFAQYGYRTVACGKLHHLGIDQMQGWTHRIGMEMEVAPRYIEGRVEAEYAKYPPPITHKWGQDKEVKRAGVGPARHIMHDQYAVEGALHYISDHYLDPYYDRAIPKTPLMLKVSLVQPHYPYITPHQDKFEYYLNRVPIYQDQMVFDHPFLGGRFKVRVGQEVDERELRRATAAYYAMIETVDDEYNRVINALRHAGQDLDDWIIVYTTDHGEMLGEHGVFEKQKFFEASARVPLIIRWPKGFQGGRVVQENVNLCDLFATFCDLAGIPTPPDLDSRSLAPLLRGEAVDWVDETVSQFGENLMIKRGSLKYQSYGDDPEVLIDLDRDPQELVNVIDESRYADQLAGFRQRRTELGF